MNYPCELIQDLLPLYEEDLCSPASRTAVEAHLRECPDCQKLTKSIPEPIPPEAPAADRAVAKGLKRTRRRWAASLMVVVLLVPLLLACWNQYRGNGLCFTNLDETMAARRFVTALEEGRWADAAAMVDFSTDYRDIQEALNDYPSGDNDGFSPVEFGDETWYTRLPEDCLQATLEDTVLTALEQGLGHVMIPPEVMDSILTKELEGIWQDGEWYNLWQFHYRRTETPWGTYVCAHLAEDAEAYLMTSDLVPEAIYEAAMTERQLDLQASHLATWEAYGHVANMTEDEFCGYMRKKYAAELAELAAADTAITSGGLDAIARAYYTGTDIGWDVYYRLNIRQGEKQSVHRIRLSVVNGAIHSPALEQMSQFTEVDRELHKAFYPSAHPDY